jgi:hypothetical protein
VNPILPAKATPLSVNWVLDISLLAPMDQPNFNLHAHIGICFLSAALLKIQRKNQKSNKNPDTFYCAGASFNKMHTLMRN